MWYNREEDHMEIQDLQFRVKTDEDGNLVLNTEDLLYIVDNLDDEQLLKFIDMFGSIIFQMLLEEEQEKPFRIDGTDEIM